MRRIPEYQGRNFETMVEAAENGHLALLSTRLTEPIPAGDVSVVVMMNAHIDENGEEMIDFAPVALMFEGNPYEILAGVEEEE